MKARSSKRRKATAGAKTTRKGKRWSQKVTEGSNALDLERKVFTKTPRQIALSLKRSADRSRRRKGTPFQSAMSMLNFYQNRAGRTLSAEQKRALLAAKDELRRLYKRKPASRSSRSKTSPPRKRARASRHAK